jgi:glutathione peroxidase
MSFLLWQYIILIYLAVINIVTFFLYGIDKWKAKRSKWRIEEATLLWWAAFGGSIGALLGMKAWHHKTLHKKFKYGIPAILLAQIAIAGVLILTACSSGRKDFYTHTRDNACADIFYVCSTETTDWINEQGDTIHFADMTKSDHRAALCGEMRGVDSLVCPDNCNFYAPYYNQATLEGLLRDTALFIPRCAKATEEIIAAFDDYMRHENNGRPFVLMGYSQGGYAVVELLKHLTAEQVSRMVAAYVIGYQVTASDLQHPNIRAAQHATDTGVTICYNSVAFTQAAIDILSGNTAIGINPVNWSTDATPATYCFDFGGAHDTLIATLDTLTHLTVIEGYKGACPMLPFVGKEGNYHCLEIPLYYHSIKQNILQKTNHSITMTTIYDFKTLNNRGKEVNLADYQGQVILVVNTASKCGFTPQYDGLEALYKKYKEQGFIILGFPCDQFANQEPGSDEQIEEFCRLNHGVTFPLMAKSDVNGANANPIFEYLKAAAPTEEYKGLKAKATHAMLKRISKSVEKESDILWNFTKFLISKDGKTIQRYAPVVEPKDFEKDIEAML